MALVEVETREKKSRSRSRSRSNSNTLVERPRVVFLRNVIISVLLNLLVVQPVDFDFTLYLFKPIACVASSIIPCRAFSITLERTSSLNKSPYET